MYVAGRRSARRVADPALRTCIRSCSTRKSGSPRSLSAMTSPSTSRSRSPSGLRLSSGHATVTGFSLRLSSRVPCAVVSASTRTPSHLTSCDHPESAGTWVPLVASMGRTGPSCLSAGPTDGFCAHHRSHWLPAGPTRGTTMRAIWKGAVSFGLVSVPVKLYAATESHDVSFRQVHAKDGGRIKYQRVCSIDGEEVAYADIAKGYETEDGEMVILTDEDMEQLPSSSSREIAVEKFVPSNQIDPMLFEKSYYLEPEKSGLKPYALLRDALRESDRVAVVTVAIRNRTAPAMLRVKDDVLVMQTMMWPDEIRNADFGSLKDVDKPKPQELEMARLLLDTLAGDYDPDELEDDYADAVQALVQAKLEGGEVKRTKEEAPSAGEVVDLLAALQKSV